MHGSKHGNILERLISIQSSLPRKQEQLSAYILENHHNIGIMTIKELAENAGVGTTTVMRLIKALGYDSFVDLKKEFHHIQVDHSHKWINVQKSFSRKENNSYTTLSSVGQESVNLIEESINPQLVESLNEAIEIIDKASRINLVGFRSYRAIAIYLELLLAEFHPNIQQLSYDSDAMIDRILQFEEDEVLIVFAFSNYVQRAIDAATLTKERNIKIILITDQLSCPIAPYADVILKVDVEGKYFTVVPIIMLVEALVIELGKRNADTSVAKIRNLFEQLKKQNYIID